MNIERFEDLIEWTRQTHGYLSQCLAHCSEEHAETRAKWLLAYLAEHEQALAKTIARIEQHADPKALHTWVYDYLVHNPVTLHSACDRPYARMSVEEISREIFEIHNQLIDLYRSLERRAEITEARELLADLLQLEEHETMRLAQQVNRLHEL